MAGNESGFVKITVKPAFGFLRRKSGPRIRRTVTVAHGLQRHGWCPVSEASTGHQGHLACSLCSFFPSLEPPVFSDGLQGAPDMGSRGLRAVMGSPGGRRRPGVRAQRLLLVQVHESSLLRCLPSASGRCEETHEMSGRPGAQSVKRPTLGFSSGRDLRVHGTEPHIRLRAQCGA